MGYVKEPEGVDFEINGKPWTKKEKEEISQIIKKLKAKKKASKNKPKEKRDGVMNTLYNNSSYEK